MVYTVKQGSVYNEFTVNGALYAENERVYGESTMNSGQGDQDFAVWRFTRARMRACVRACVRVCVCVCVCVRLEMLWQCGSEEFQKRSEAKSVSKRFNMRKRSEAKRREAKRSAAKRSPQIRQLSGATALRTIAFIAVPCVFGFDYEVDDVNDRAFGYASVSENDKRGR